MGKILEGKLCTDCGSLLEEEKVIVHAEELGGLPIQILLGICVNVECKRVHSTKGIPIDLHEGKLYYEKGAEGEAIFFKRI